jgi:hypothetical protein
MTMIVIVTMTVSMMTSNNGDENDKGILNTKIVRLIMTKTMIASEMMMTMIMRIKIIVRR